MGSFFSKKRYRVLMLGLDNAGKTSIVQRVRQEQAISTVPTVGFLVETLSIGKAQLTVWDVGGQDKIRPLWRHYFNGTQGLIFVVDSSDRQRIEEAAREFDKIVTTREMRNVCVLVFCNKQDIPDCMEPQEIQNSFNMKRLSQPYLVMPCSAKHGSGLDEGLRWLSKQCR